MSHTRFSPSLLPLFAALLLGGCALGADELGGGTGADIAEQGGGALADDCANGACDVDECALDNGGCGAASLWSCANQLDAAPVCSQIPQLIPLAVHPLDPAARSGGAVVAVGSRLAMIADTEGDGIIRMYDVSDAQNVRLLDSLAGSDCDGCLGSYPSSLALRGGTLIVGSNTGVRGFDLFGDSFTWLPSLSHTGTVMGQPKVRDDRLFWTDESVGIGVVDLESGAAAGLYSAWTADAYPYDGDANRTATFLADAELGLVIWTDAASAPVATVPGTAYRVAATSSHAFVSNGSETNIYDVTTPSAPTVVGAIPFGTMNGVLRIEDDLLYMTKPWGDSLAIYDVSTPTEPTRVTALPEEDLVGDADVARSGDRLYVLDDEALRIYTAWGF